MTAIVQGGVSAEADTDRIVALLYDGITCPGDWYDALDAMREVLGAACFHTLTVRRADCSVVGAGLANLESPPDKVREYEQHLARDDIRMQMPVNAPLGTPVTDHTYFGARTLSRSPIYVDWLAPLGLRHTLAMGLRADDDTREVLGFIRPRAEAPYGPESETFCRRLSPHLVRASELRARMAQLGEHAATGLSALDALPQGIAVVDEACRIDHLNARAAACAGPGGLSDSAQGRLRLAWSALQSAFEQRVREACVPAGGARAGVLHLPVAGSVVRITVLPLKPSHPLAVLRQRHRALVVFAHPAEAAPVEPRQLESLLGLSPTEARLALLLASGKTVKDFAAAQHCSEHTARSHLRNVMRKTDCHRQAELVLLVQSLRD